MKLLNRRYLKLIKTYLQKNLEAHSLRFSEKVMPNLESLPLNTVCC